jgi:hypothetical protein
MSVHIEKCGESACGHLFEVEQCSAVFGPGRAVGVIECPHCGKQAGGDPRKVYVSRRIRRELEAWPEE